MCGIVGHVSWGADLTGGDHFLDGCIDTMALRGAEESGTWARGPVSFGHRRLAVIDREGGKQPMVCGHPGDPVVALTFMGEVYNFQALRAELAARGRSFRTRSDTEVIIQAYLEWGRDFTTRLSGVYGFALWDEWRQELLLVRDRLGVKPLFYAPRPDGILFGSEPKAILGMPGFETAVDAEGLREVMSPVPTPGRCAWRGIREVPPATLIVVDRRGCQAQTYWSLEAREHHADLRETIARTRELLAGSVREQLVCDVPLCSFLSGGLDSSVITALAAEQYRAHETVPWRSFTVTFEGYEETFVPDEVRATPDAPFARAVADHVGSDHTEVVLSSGRMMDRAVRDRVLQACDRPPFGEEMATTEYLLSLAIRERRSTVALSGDGADELFGGLPWFRPRDPDADTFPWIGQAGRYRPFSFFRPEIDRKLRLAEYLGQQYRDALARVPLIPGEDPAEQAMREITFLAITRYMPGLLERKDRTSMVHGLVARVPYCDHRLVEYLFSVPWKFKSFDGREKSLLRAAGTGLLPGSVLRREKSNFPATQDTAYDALVAREFRALLDRRDSALFEIADPARLDWLARDMGGASSALFTRRARERALSVARWLDLYRPRLLL